jgi:hypothetical protein
VHFVELYNSKSVKSGYANRKALDKGLKKLCQEESRIFNGLFTDMTNVQDDLKRNYISMKLVIATELIKICGFDGIYDTKHSERDDIETRLKKHNKILTEKMTGICMVLGRKKSRIPNTKTWTFNTKIKFINSALYELLNLKISPSEGIQKHISLLV